MYQKIAPDKTAHLAFRSKCANRLGERALFEEQGIEFIYIQDPAPKDLNIYKNLRFRV